MILYLRNLGPYCMEFLNIMIILQLKNKYNAYKYLKFASLATWTSIKSYKGF